MIKATVRGIPDLKRELQGVVVQLQRRILGRALSAAGRVVRDDARRNAPVLRHVLKAPHRAPGTVRKAIVVRPSKSARRAGNVGVFVNVRPAKAGARGAKSKTDPFYWRFLEFGTRFFRSGVGVRFLQGAARRLPDALQVFIGRVGPEVQRLNNRTKGRS